MTESSTPDLRSLLAQVAAGQVAPEEASQRIAATGPSADPPLPPGPTLRRPLRASGCCPHLLAATPAPDGADVPIDRVVVQAAAVKLVLIGDPTVTGASVEGPHIARRDGGALIIDTDAEPGLGDFFFESSARRTGQVLRALARHRDRDREDPPRSPGRGRPSRPAASWPAGSMGGLRFVVEAGSLKAVECSGPIDGRVEAGSAKLDWLLDRGALQPQLRARERTAAARPALRRDGRGSRHAWLSRSRGLRRRSGSTLVVGAGSATLDIKVELGSAKVQVAS